MLWIVFYFSIFHSISKNIQYNTSIGSSCHPTHITGYVGRQLCFGCISRRWRYLEAQTTSRESHVSVDSTGAESGPLPVISLPWEPTFPFIFRWFKTFIGGVKPLFHGFCVQGYVIFEWQHKWVTGFCNPILTIWLSLHFFGDFGKCMLSFPTMWNKAFVPKCFTCSKSVKWNGNIFMLSLCLHHAGNIGMCHFYGELLECI